MIYIPTRYIFVKEKRHLTSWSLNTWSTKHILFFKNKTKNAIEMILFKWKAFYIKDTYWISTMVIIHRQEDIILAIYEMKLL